MNSKIIISTLIGCLLGATVGYSASVVNLPHTFTAGTPIKASEVNANFSALAQEIASVKGTTHLNKSSSFTESTIEPINAAVGSTIMVGSKSFVIKQKVGIQDPITGKKYTLNYPKLSTDSIFGVNYYAHGGCADGYLGRGSVIREGKSNLFTSYVGFYGKYLENPSFVGSVTFISVKLSNNLCAEVGLEQADLNFDGISAIINRATELQKYISVQEN